MVSHPAPPVHAPALLLLGQLLQRCPAARESFRDTELPALVSGMLRGHPASPQGFQAVLALLHQHPVSLNTTYELEAALPPDLDLSMTPLLLPLLSSCTEVSLSHNLLARIHELAAHLPLFLDSLLSASLGPALLSLLQHLGDKPTSPTDLGCGFESDLLLEDVHNILRLVVVRQVELPRLQYELVLDLLFLAASQCREAGPGARGNLRLAVCVLLEEGLDVLQKALTSLLLFKPASASLERDFQGPAAWGEARKPARKPAKKSAATMSM